MPNSDGVERSMGAYARRLRKAERGLRWGTLLLAFAGAPRLANAQQSAEGFAVNRIYPSAPGGGWIVMDDLDLRGGLGGAMGVSFGYARRALRVSDGLQEADVVARDAFADFGLAITYDRWRGYLNFGVPLVTQGESAVIGGYRFTAPSVDLGSHPDTIREPRLGFDARLFGESDGPLRLGVGAQLVIPQGHRYDYDTDGTCRAMFRLLLAGDWGDLSYAGHLGVHVRPLDERHVPGSPRGSEQLFGIAAGLRVPLRGDGSYSAVIGPEVYGETAYTSFFGSDTTGVEALLTAWLDRRSETGEQFRAKLGIGPGIHPHYGAAEWRLVLGLELLGRSARE